MVCRYHGLRMQSFCDASKLKKNHFKSLISERQQISGMPKKIDRTTIYKNISGTMKLSLRQDLTGGQATKCRQISVRRLHLIRELIMDQKQ